MQQAQLQQRVEQISQQFFKRPFLHQATFNKRLRSSGGRYLLQTHNLEFNSKMLAEHGLETLDGIIKHELCHYHLHLLKRGYRHCDADFKQLLKQVEGLRYAPTLKKNQPQLQYVCQKCQQVYWRKRQVDVKRYVCARCHGKLVLK